MKRHGSGRKGTGACLRPTRLASAALALIAASLSWGTLCLGEDGHLVLEPRAADECFSGGPTGTPIPPDVETTLRADASLPCCGPCTDLTELSRPWVKPDGPTPPDRAPLLATTARMGAMDPHWTRADSFPDAAESTFERLPVSSVLRC